MTVRRSVLLFLLLCCGLFSRAQDLPDLSQGRRVALVIGNNKYTQINELKNAVHDAEDMAATLQRLGFEVQRHLDVNGIQFTQALEDFKRKCAGADVAIFFYAGHGFQIQGDNYLVPVDVAPTDEILLRRSCKSCEEVRELVESTARLRVLVFDACRDNPFKSGARAMRGGGGMSAMQGTAGTLISLSTGPGTQASDDPNGRNGLFTKNLLTALQGPSPELNSVFKRAGELTYVQSSGKQQPWTSASVIPFRFRFQSAAQASPTKAAVRRPQVTKTTVPAARVASPAAAKPAPLNPVMAAGKSVLVGVAESSAAVAGLKAALVKCRNASFGSASVPVTALSPAQLQSEDYVRLGFSKDSLPVVALLKVSPEGNWEGVCGSPPAILRKVTNPELAAKIVISRWAQIQNRAVPVSLSRTFKVFQPGKLVVLNVAESAEQRDAFERELGSLTAAEGLSADLLPVLSTDFQQGTLSSADFERLGLGKEALPAVCLMRMSESGNPSSVVGDGVIRYAYFAPRAARELLRQWSRLEQKPLRSLNAEAEMLKLESFAWAEKSAGTSRFRYTAKNFRCGVAGRVWLQEETRILKADGQPIPQLGAVVNHQQASFSGEPVQTLQSGVTMPASPGQYTLELTVRDKLANQRFSLSIPFQI